MIITILILVLVISFQVHTYIKYKKANLALKAEFAPIIEAETAFNSIDRKYRTLQENYGNGLASLKSKQKKLARYFIGAGTLDTISYKQSHEEGDLHNLEKKLKDIRKDIKEMVRSKKACMIPKNLVVNGSRVEARKMMTREVKLRLRCIDNATKAGLSLVSWNNINRLKERLKDTFDEVNDSGSILNVFITDKYLELRKKELEIKYEIDALKTEIKENEKEERRIQREAEREEKRIAEAARKAEEERKFYDNFVAKEIERLRNLDGSEHAELESKIEQYQQELDKLRENEIRAISMAQQTRAGYIYIISNPKSFGKGICKIGMTRRVNPQDRVKELGDASVPELFDVHAFAYSEDAPKLEKHLHQCFKEKRVNLVNNRKEFFFIDPSLVLGKLQSCEDKIEITEFQ